MAKFGKWVGGGLGWAFGGPIGAIIGFAIGSVLDNTTVKNINETGSTTRNDFDASLLVLTAAVLKADGKVLKSELDFVKAFFVRQFGVEQTKEKMLLLRNILQQEIPVHEVSLQIREYMDYHSRLLLLQYLFGIAAADNEIAKSEKDIVESIAGYFGVSKNDYDSIKAMFIKEFDNYYKILEVPETASDDEIKKAYRNMALKYHPDRVIHLGEEYQNAAKEKFQKLNEAYEKIKKQRGTFN